MLQSTSAKLLLENTQWPGARHEKSKRHTLLSSETDARRLPSGRNATPHTCSHRLSCWVCSAKINIKSSSMPFQPQEGQHSCLL